MPGDNVLEKKSLYTKARGNIQKNNAANTRIDSVWQSLNAREQKTAKPFGNEVFSLMEMH